MARIKEIKQRIPFLPLTNAQPKTVDLKKCPIPPAALQQIRWFPQLAASGARFRLL
jgi:hypothetical protein